MKRIVFVLAATAAVVSFAGLRTLTEKELSIVKRPYSKLTPEERKLRPEIMKLHQMIENGGEMLLPGTPKGTIRFVNLQKRVASTNLTRLVHSFSSMKKYDIAVVDADCPATVKITLVDKKDQPSLAVYPDDLKAVVNVAKLDVGNPKPAFLASRLRKEALRAFASLMAGSSYGMSLYSYQKSPAALDEIAHENFPVDIIMRAEKMLAAAGLVPAEPTTYREALKEGHDIAPTNDYQKAIYEQVKKAKK